MKKNPVVIAIIVLLIVLVAIIVIYLMPEKESTKEDSSSESSTYASIQTIENTLSSSGQISSALDEKVTLHASYYFSELLVDKNEGEICTTSHYIEIQSIDSLCMSLSVSENDINKVEIGDLVDITITSTSEKIEGRITSISEVGTYSSNGSYFTAKVSFENTGTLKIGMSATCEIILERAENVVAVPLEAIQTSDDGSYVIVIKEDGTQENVTVETGISNDAYIEIKSGITEKTKVVMSESTSSSSNSSRGGFNFEGGPGGSRNGGNSGSGTQFQGGDMPGGGNRPSI